MTGFYGISVNLALNSRLVLEHRLELLIEFLDLGSDDELAIALPRVVIKVVLMVLFGRVKVLERGDFRHDGPRKDLRGVELLLVLFGGLSLLIGVIKDGRAVLRAHIVALLIERRGIVSLPEHFQKVLKRNLGWIVSDLNDFRMAGAASANVLITGVLDRAAAIARNDRLHPLEPLEDGFAAPEATFTERGGGQLLGTCAFRRRL